MRITTRGQLAVSAMTDLALRQKMRPVALSTISARQGTSLSYLEQLFSALRRAGLVDSTRGPGGGYTLGHRADSITVADIIGAVDGQTTALAEVVARKGEPVAQDLTQALWDTLNTKMIDYMQSISLRSLVMEQLAKGVRVEAPLPANRGVFKKPKPMVTKNTTPNSVFALGKTLMARG